MGRPGHEAVLVLFLLQASKAAGVMHLLQCYRVFEARSKGIQLSYCVGLEIGNNTYYLKAESASIYNEWIKVRNEQPLLSCIKEEDSYISHEVIP